MASRIQFLIPAAALLCPLAYGLAGPPAAGVLLLDNQRILQGEVERRGDQYLVRRDGGETAVPAARVLAALPDLDAAYRFLREKTDANDVDARLRLARWCDMNGLRAQAAAEAKTALDLSPGRAIVQATYQQFERKAAAPAPPPAPPAKLPAAVVAAAEFAEPIECGAESFKRFATKVQPVLMNACASCHAGDRAGKFRLEKVFSDSLNSRPATQRNLNAALAAIDRAKPAASGLLQQAVTAHGGAALPPLRDRGVPGYKHLDEWVKLTLSDASAPPMPMTPPVEPAKEIVGTAASTPGEAAKSEFGADKAKKDAPAGPKDPFDPAIFNRQHHPEVEKPGS
jgi:hypothetical protein